MHSRQKMLDQATTRQNLQLFALTRLRNVFALLSNRRENWKFDLHTVYVIRLKISVILQKDLPCSLALLGSP